MLKLPIPDLLLNNIYELKPDTLVEKGVSLLLMDLDNTLDTYHAQGPSVHLRNWIDALKKAGIEPFIYSNSRGDRPGKFARALCIGYINKARKPDTQRLFRLLQEKGVSPANTAIIGDQIYTDVLCGRRAGIMTLAIKPLNLSNPFHFIRYGAEFPFRLANKRQLNKEEKKD